MAEQREITMILDDKLAAGDVIVLDGAIGTEISRLGVEMPAPSSRRRDQSGPAWRSARWKTGAGRK